MRIAIDASSAAISKKTGVAKYITRLIEHLEGLNEGNEYRIYYRLSRWKKREYFYRPRRQTTKVRLFQEPFFRAAGIDVFHGPDARLPRIRGPKLVATVHDLFSLVSDEFADEDFRRKKAAQYKDIAERADRIICVSESTRSDFVRFFPEAAAKTCVIYEGVDEQFYPRPDSEVMRVKEKYGIPGDYVLYVGALSKRKNIIRMFDAFRQVRRQTGSDIQFVAAGKLTYGKEEILKYIEDNRCEREIPLPGYVADEDLPALYSGARVLLFTTLYEGFGLPILEALACGTPVVTSNMSATAEVGGALVRQANPTSVEEIASCLGEALSDSGRERVSLNPAGRFSWGRTAELTLGEYVS